MPAQSNTSSAPTSGFDPSQLADIHLPAEISHWPTAPGWWISILLIFTMILIAWGWKKQRDNNPAIINARRLKRLKTEAQRELEAIKQKFTGQQNAHQSIELLSVFLRRFALSVYEREQVASLTDEQWLKILDDLSNSQQFSDTFKPLLTEAPYQSPDTVIDPQLLEQLFSATESLLDSIVKKQLSGGHHV